MNLVVGENGNTRAFTTPDSNIQSTYKCPAQLMNSATHAYPTILAALGGSPLFPRASPSAFPAAMTASSKVIASAFATKNGNERPKKRRPIIVSPNEWMRAERTNAVQTCVCEESQVPRWMWSVRTTSLPQCEKC